MTVRKALADRKVSEFFAGIGLMRMGLERAGWEVVFANDISPDKEEMYQRHFGEEDGHFLLGDVHKLVADDLPTVGLATASFPCTDLSLAGRREGLAGRQSSAFWGFVGALEKLGERRPPLVLLENVPGFLTSHQGRDMVEALSALNRLGYTVDMLILDAERFVPQSRVRLFIVGALDHGVGEGRVAETPGFYESRVRPRAVSEFIFTHPEIRWSVRPLPEPPVRRMTLDDVIESLEEDDPMWWSASRVDYLVNQMSGKHRETLEKMRTKPTVTHATAFRRVRNGKSMAELRYDQVAGCLRTPKGGSARQILVEGGRGRVRVRLLTPRECARLMGADEYRIEAPLNQALFGFGDAVCVPVVEWIARNYLNPVAEEWLRGEAETKADWVRKSA